MATTTSSPPVTAQRGSRPARRKPGKDTRSGNPIVYLAALVLIGLMLGPVLYIITGGFRTNSQITTNPAGLPDPWVFGFFSVVLLCVVFWCLFGYSTFVV